MAASITNRMCGECLVFRVCGVPMADSYFTGPGGTGYARGKCVSGIRFGYCGNRPGYNGVCLSYIGKNTGLGMQCMPEITNLVFRVKRCNQ